MVDVLIVSDGKPGHMNQSRGLAEALIRQRPGWSVAECDAKPWYSSVDLSVRPEKLVIAAGHSTHMKAMMLGWRLSVPTVVLMKPSLPKWCFSFCLIPQHDRPVADNRVIPTIGALNRMLPVTKKVDSAMVLIGGPSKHYGWDDQAILQQVIQITATEAKDWLVTTSRRTPTSLTDSLRQHLPETVDFLPVEETSPDWLGQNLPLMEECWVSPDSVSMVYEALTAGCNVGLLELPDTQESRVVRGIRGLVESGMVVTSPEQMSHRQPAEPLAEADRCATEILEQLAL